MKLDRIFEIVRNGKGLLAAFLWGVFFGFGLAWIIDAIFPAK